MKTNYVAAGVALLSSLMLSACGGGGGDSTSALPAASAAQGAYLGTVSNGYEHNTIILDDGQFYTLYGVTTAAGFVASRFLQGSGNANNGSFSSSNVKDYYGGSAFSGTLSASYSASNFSGTLTEGGTSVTFTGAPINAAVFDYNSAASLSTVSGVWNLTSIDGDPVALTLAANGSYTAFSGTCSITGTVTPRPSGKNVFNFTQTFGSTCPLAGQSASGIAITYLLTNGQRQLIVAETNASRTFGTALFGVR